MVICVRELYGRAGWSRGMHLIYLPALNMMGTRVGVTYGIRIITVGTEEGSRSPLVEAFSDASLMKTRHLAVNPRNLTGTGTELGLTLRCLCSSLS